VVDVERGELLPERSLLIQDDRIERLAPAAELAAPPGATVVDGAGRFLLPGLFDAHVHLNEDDDPGDLWLYLANGVTTVRSMHGGPFQLGLRERVRTGALVGPRILTTGPTTATLRIHTVEQAREAARAQEAAGYDAIKMYGDGADTMPRETYHALIESAHALGLPVLGHAPRNLPFQAVLDERQDSIDHMEEIVYTDEGLARLVRPYVDLQFGRKRFADHPELMGKVPDFAAELRREIAALAGRVKAAGLVVTPTLCTFATIQATTDDAFFALHERPELAYVDPARARRWTPERARFRNGGWKEVLPFMAAYLRRHLELQRALTLAFHEAGVPILTGTDSPFDFVVQGFSLHDELAELARSGLSPLAALRAATLVPARAMGLADSGTIAAGRRADLVLVARDPLQDLAAARAVDGLCLAGRWISGETLRAELARIAARQASLAPLVEELSAAVDSGEVERAVALFEAAGDARARLAGLVESGLNELGYRHLRGGRAGEAHAVLARNAALFPRSANAWDSLGEALWKLDRDEEAVAAYEHALELDPGFDNARRMIERILSEQ
jgi:imidazolonepropionase-like amidohydrolase